MKERFPSSSFPSTTFIESDYVTYLLAERASQTPSTKQTTEGDGMCFCYSSR